MGPKSRGILKMSFSEVFAKTPKAVKRTARKFGEKRAKKQRIAIALNKARRAGARIPKPRS